MTLQAALGTSVSSRVLTWSHSLHFGLSESESQQFDLFIFWEWGPRESGQFQVLPEAICNCLPSCLRSFAEGWIVLILEKTVIEHSGKSEELSFPSLALQVVTVLN